MTVNLGPIAICDAGTVVQLDKVRVHRLVVFLLGGADSCRDLARAPETRTKRTGPALFGKDIGTQPSPPKLEGCVIIPKGK